MKVVTLRFRETDLVLLSLPTVFDSEDEDIFKATVSKICHLLSPGPSLRSLNVDVCDETGELITTIAYNDYELDFIDNIGNWYRGVKKLSDFIY